MFSKDSIENVLSEKVAMLKLLSTHTFGQTTEGLYTDSLCYACQSTTTLLISTLQTHFVQTIHKL